MLQALPIASPDSEFLPKSVEITPLVVQYMTFINAYRQEEIYPSRTQQQVWDFIQYLLQYTIAPFHLFSIWIWSWYLRIFTFNVVTSSVCYTPQSSILLNYPTGKIFLGFNDTGHIVCNPKKEYQCQIQSYPTRLSKKICQSYISKAFKPPREMWKQRTQVKIKIQGQVNSKIRKSLEYYQGWYPRQVKQYKSNNKSPKTGK